MDMRTLYELYLHALGKEPSIGEAVRADIAAYYERDPACDQYCLPLLYFKGYHTIQAHRINHCLWKEGRKTLACFLQNRASEVFGVDIHPAARFGQRIMIDHGAGVVIGETAVLGNDISILHGVTLGGSGKEGGDRHPKIGDGVMIGANASVLGNIRVNEMRENRRGQRGGGGRTRLQHRRRRARPRGRQQIASQTGGGNESEFL